MGSQLRVCARPRLPSRHLLRSVRFPETFLIDAEGIIVGKITGESNAVLLGTTLDQILAGQRPGEHRRHRGGNGFN